MNANERLVMVGFKNTNKNHKRIVWLFGHVRMNNHSAQDLEQELKHNKNAQILL